MTKVEINVTIINGTGGTYPLITPLKAIPIGIANIQPLPTFKAVDANTLLSRSSGEYIPVSGEVANHAVMKGKAVVSTPIRSKEPSSL
eukprot:CAMPEP_0201980558 /NCGR_PEP_ID=MMETSP0904-20121228/70771_1 /ASSEMBLY_ACC=CAM_ASM_000553 /TAXON_ID=420261 /ORGANISM="Thalassiosira antarctica, Strain CCMP982" /LENGTH=87 /DNA_ID=CAMNT_0048532861 /DNA_START=279 /DNA_END=542 /DNA_ORIENTATION=+